MTVGREKNAVQATTNAYVSAMKIDTINSDTISFTIKNTHATAGLSWEVMAGNVSDLSDGTLVKSPATLAAAALDNYSASLPPFRFYAVYVKSSVDNTPSQATIYGISKG